MSGIELLKKNIGKVLRIVKEVDKSLEDSNLSIVEAFGIGMSGIKAWGIWKDYEEMKQEYTDLDDMEIQELHAYFCNEFNIRSDKIEEIVETLFLFALNLKVIAEGLNDRSE